MRRGHRVTVVCRSLTGSRTEQVGGVTVHRLGGATRAPGRQAYYGRLARHLVRTVRRYDVVHLHHANVQADIVVPIAAAAGRPVYLKIAGGGPSVERLGRGLRRWTAVRAFRRAAVVQTQSPDAVMSVRRLGVPAGRIVTIPNGLDRSSFRCPTADDRAAARQALGLPREATIVLSTGRFAVEKGTADLLAAWRRLDPASDAVLLLVGQPADRPRGASDLERRGHRPAMDERPRAVPARGRRLRPAEPRRGHVQLAASRRSPAGCRRSSRRSVPGPTSSPRPVPAWSSRSGTSPRATALDRLIGRSRAARPVGRAARRPSPISGSMRWPSGSRPSTPASWAGPDRRSEVRIGRVALSSRLRCGDTPAADPRTTGGGRTAGREE